MLSESPDGGHISVRCKSSGLRKKSSTKGLKKKKKNESSCLYFYSVCLLVCACQAVVAMIISLPLFINI